ncbi:MAG: radical SAM protein [Dehalococcoidales bacterium]|nr:radical SAM protein [Dehalococcoidales bacterium]
MTGKKDSDRNVVERRDFVTRISCKDYHQPMIEKFGDKYLQYRKEWESSATGDYLPAFPLQIDFEIIDYCNLKCIMCPRSIDRGSGTKLPMADYKAVIDEGATRGLKAISFGYGDEPLLRSEVIEMIEYAGSKGVMDIRLSTNATLLNADLSKKLIKSGLTYITFSIDAVRPETYKKIRGGNLNKVENNIKGFLSILAKSGQVLPVTRTSIVVMPENKAELDGFINRWQPLVDFIDAQDYIKLEKPGADNINQALDGFSCYQPWQRLAITAQGDVTPCCTFQGRELKIGNIKNDTIFECWNSRKMKKLREQLSTRRPPPVCRSCYASTSKYN